MSPPPLGDYRAPAHAPKCAWLGWIHLLPDTQEARALKKELTRAPTAGICPGCLGRDPWTVDLFPKPADMEPETGSGLAAASSLGGLALQPRGVEDTPPSSPREHGERSPQSAIEKAQLRKFAQVFHNKLIPSIPDLRGHAYTRARREVKAQRQLLANSDLPVPTIDWSEVFGSWITDVPREIRKAISWYGGIRTNTVPESMFGRARRYGLLRGWRGECIGLFDPGNLVYENAARRLIIGGAGIGPLPYWCSELNTESFGDLLEAALGADFLLFGNAKYSAGGSALGAARVAIEEAVADAMWDLAPRIGYLDGTR